MKSSPTLLLPWIQDLKRKVQALEPEAELILYGSRARQTANANSDWDFLLLVPEKPSPSWLLKLREPFTLSELELGQVISVQVFPKSLWDTLFSQTPFYENVQREGVLL